MRCRGGCRCLTTLTGLFTTNGRTVIHLDDGCHISTIVHGGIAYVLLTATLTVASTGFYGRLHLTAALELISSFDFQVLTGRSRALVDTQILFIFLVFKRKVSVIVLC
jgi:hypothetical protein